ncbi:MAG TPA: FIST N-terminal domain-containing protein [Planctomycetota bacterium]|nr:FIST N-terminal domain-containing protein [Planctomycetota bacterium]
MQFHSATAIGADLEATCRCVADKIRAGMGAGRIDLVIVFASPRYGANIDHLPVLLHDLLGASTLIGCSGAALIGEGQVIANRHSISMLAGRLPGVQLDAVALGTGDLPTPDAPPSAWHRLLPECQQPRRGLLVLCEPFHCDARALLAGLDYGWPDLPKLGGIASGSRHPEGHVLFVGRSTHRTGAAVLSMAGDVRLHAVVSQGCRPIGRVGRVTKADRNRLMTVDDAPARGFVEEQLSALTSQDLELAEHSPLFLGVASDPFASCAPSQGDFLVRNILGIDPETGNVLVGEHLPVGRQVQLHLRDGPTSARDVQERLARANPGAAQAALLLRCLGREGPDHEAFASIAGHVPLVGFHCNGEIGQVGGSTQLLGYTAVFALLRRGQSEHT